MLIDFIVVEMIKIVEDLIVVLKVIERKDVVEIIIFKYFGMFS